MLNQYGVPTNYRGKIPIRCNKRACQARRNLTKYPEEFVNWPKCHRIGCTGKVRVDKIRLKAKFDKALREKDSGKECRCSGHPRAHPYGKVTELYQCAYAEDAVIERSLTKGTFKHSPIKQNQLCDNDDGVPF